MKTTVINRECSLQEEVYHIMPELILRIIFLAFYFVNKKAPEERVQVCLSEKDLRELPENGPNIFKKSNIDPYMEKPSAKFCNGRYSILDYFCHAEFLVYYTFGNKASKTNEYWADELDEFFFSITVFLQGQ